MIESTPLARLMVLAVVFVLALLLATALNVDQHRRSLPRWLSLSVLGLTFSPIVAQEFGYLPWGEDGVFVAVVAAFALYITIPLVLTTVRRTDAGTTIEDVSPPEFVGSHYRPTTDDFANGVYRVVGAGDTITLLRVTDPSGHRRHSGSVHTISRNEFDTTFDAATDPDAGVHPVRTLHTQFTGVYWSIRRYL